MPWNADNPKWTGWIEHGLNMTRTGLRRRTTFIYIKWWTKTSTSPWVLVAHIYLKYDPGQVTLFRQPRFPWKKGISLTIRYLLGAQVVFPVAIFMTRKMPPLHPRNPRQHGSFASFREPRCWLQGSPNLYIYIHIYIYIRGVIVLTRKPQTMHYCSF